VLRKYYIRTVGSGPAPIPPMGGRSPRRCGDDTGSMPRRRPSRSGTFRRLLHDLVTLARLGLTSRAHLAAENLFLRKQLALYQERRTKPRRPDLATRVALVLLSRVLDWRSMLMVVKPETLIRWHRQGWRLFWRCKSRPGRPRIPVDLRRLIITMARANPTWGEERIASELLLKLGLAVSPRTVGRYLRDLRPPRGGRPSQRWATFVRNHAHGVLACDFFITVTARFRILCVFVVLEVGTRRIVHWNVTEHPTADWTIQQFRTVITPETAHRFVLTTVTGSMRPRSTEQLLRWAGACSRRPCGRRRRTPFASA
jgi:putative transposase